VVFGPLEGENRYYSKMVEAVSTEALMPQIKAKMRKWSVSGTKAFWGYQSLNLDGKHQTINSAKTFVRHRPTKKHRNVIEGF